MRSADGVRSLRRIEWIFGWIDPVLTLVKANSREVIDAKISAMPSRM